MISPLGWWYTYLIPVLRRQRQEDRKFETSLGYIPKKGVFITREVHCRKYIIRILKYSSLLSNSNTKQLGI
jgi:hypothetical protein